MANNNDPSDSNDLADKDKDTETGDLVGTDQDTDTTDAVFNNSPMSSSRVGARRLQLSFTDPPPESHYLPSRVVIPSGAQNATMAPGPLSSLQNPRRAANPGQTESNPTYTRRRRQSTSGEGSVAGPSRSERYNLRRAALSRAAAQALSTIEDNTSKPEEQTEQPAAESPTEPNPDEAPENPNPANTKFYCTDPAISTLAPNADHILCLSTHLCIWTSPSKAREVHAQRTRWLQEGKPLEATQRADGYFPALTDEFGVPMTKAVGGLATGQDPNEVYDWYVMERFTAVILPGELGVRVGGDEWKAHWEALGRLLENGDEWKD